MKGQTEAGFQRAVIQAAKLLGWKVTHYAPVRVVRRGGAAHFTPVVGDPGGPDLLLARGGAVVLAELKTDAGRVRPDQKAWAAAIGASYRLWRPSQWPEILAELRGDCRQNA